MGAESGADTGVQSAPVRPGWGAVLGSRARVLAFGGALVVLVGVAVLVGRIGGWTGRPTGTAVTELPPLPSRSQPSVPPPPPRGEAVTLDTPNEVAGWVWLVVAAVAAVIVYLLLRRAWEARRRLGERRRMQSEPDPDTGPQLEDEPPPAVPESTPGRQFDARAAADAIVSCWVWVEEWAAARGVPRLSFETPTEFLDRVVGRAAGPDDPGGRPVDDVVRTAGPSVDPSEGPAAEADRSAEIRGRQAAAQVLLPLYQRARFDVAALDPESAVRARDAALTVCGRDPVTAP